MSNPTSTPTSQHLMPGTLYKPRPTPIPPAFTTLLSTYSSIPPPSQESHIINVRDRAYTLQPYPCLGTFRFLSLSLSTHPLYHSHILPLLLRSSTPHADADATNSASPPSAPVFLDIGTCLGQDLRKLVVDGVEPGRVYGADLGWEYVEVGYELFGDEERFPRDRFVVPGDVLAEGEGGGGGGGSDGLVRLDGKCDVVSLIGVFHLFGLEEQKRAVGRVMRLLRRDRGARERVLVVGMQVGRVVAREEERSAGKKRFLHDEESWRELWGTTIGNDVGESQVLEWEVHSVFEPLGMKPRVEDGGGQDAEEGPKAGEMGDDGYRWHVWWVWVGFR